MLYYTEFQYYTADVQWDEVAKLAALGKGLFYRLKNDLIMAATDPAIVADLVALCNCLDMHCCTLQSEFRSESQAPNTTLYVSAIVPALVSAASTSSGIEPGLMDL